MNVLDRIIAYKREEVAAARRRLPLSELRRLTLDQDRPQPRFASALVASPHRPALIAEIKRRSPSAGEIRPGLAPDAIARQYAAAGASCLSVLTDGPSFGGSLESIAQARAGAQLPILRKDFIVDAYQIWEAAHAGAECVLLIAAALDSGALAELFEEASELRLDVLVELHDESDLRRLRHSGIRPALLGINNRDLKRQLTDLGIFETLAPQVADFGAILVAESGIATRADAERMHRAGAAAMLVGESLLRQPDLGAATRSLLAG